MPHHVLAVAESDSYLKWSVSLMAQLPTPSRVEVVIARSPVRPSPAQRAAALVGTAFEGYDPEVLSPAQLARRVDRDRPDAVILACTGPSAHAYQEALARTRHRPVLIAGIPGIALPARRRAWGYRGSVDLFVVHSHREVDEYDRVRMLMGKSGRVGLATIPFLAPARTPTGFGLNTVPRPADSPEHQVAAVTLPEPGRRVLFATQAKVPKLRRERMQILAALERLALDRPDLEVVVKTRGVSGEFHTHHERHHYADLWDEMVAADPARRRGTLGFAAGSMAEQLEQAAALVTVSSTAVLEAMALDLPVLLVDEFGVSENLINQVFVGSGCLGGLDRLTEGDFRRPQKWWMAENYFHPVAENTWIGLLDELVAQARAGSLPAIAAGLDRGRSMRRRRRDRLRLTSAGSALVRVRHRWRKHLKRPAGSGTVPQV